MFVENTPSGNANKYHICPIFCKYKYNIYLLFINFFPKHHGKLIN